MTRTAKRSERQISRSGPEQARVTSLPWPLLLARIRMTVDEINAYQVGEQHWFPTHPSIVLPTQYHTYPIICGVHGDRDTLCYYYPSRTAVLV
jgi:hypothetical protein